MHRVIAIVFILLPFTYGAYLPTLFWDTSNPIHPITLANSTTQPNTKQPKRNGFKECEDIIPQELNIRTTTGNKVNVSWQPPSNLTEPCREVLVPAKQRNVALCELAADLKYIVQERARTAKGPGDYCKEKTFETDGKKEPEISAQHDEKSTSVDGKSIAIGFVIGVFLTLVFNSCVNVLAVLKRLWYLIFSGDEKVYGITLVRNLPVVQEENINLHVSDCIPNFITSSL